MTPAEKTMLVTFLRELSDRQGNDGCNDLELENTPGNVAMCHSVSVSHAGDDGWEPWEAPDSGELTFYAPANFIVVGYLARMLESEVAYYQRAIPTS